MIAKAVERSANRKCGPVSVTMAGAGSCWPQCPFRSGGCYARHGPQGWLSAHLDGGNPGFDHRAIARMEAAAIDRLSGRRPLRLHVVGDCADDVAARMVSAAAERYATRFRQPVWTYTHAWRTVARTSWRRVSVLASCETPAHVVEARALGYAAALVLPQRPAVRDIVLSGVRVLLCPETEDRVERCTHCQLCWYDRELLRARLTIGFVAHGAGAPLVRALVDPAEHSP